MARFAATHSALVLGGNGELRALTAGKVVIGTLQIFADRKFARVVEQVFESGTSFFLGVDRVVDREVAVSALQTAFGVNIPGTGQIGFAGNVNTRFGDFLRGDHLAGGGGLRVTQVAG